MSRPASKYALFLFSLRTRTLAGRTCVGRACIPVSASLACLLATLTPVSAGTSAHEEDYAQKAAAQEQRVCVQSKRDSSPRAELFFSCCVQIAELLSSSQALAQVCAAWYRLSPTVRYLFLRHVVAASRPSRKRHARSHTVGSGSGFPAPAACDRYC